MPQKEPLILTLKSDEQSQAYFDRSRQLYFPPERNFLKGHLTLFHQLPNEEATYQSLMNFNFQSFSLQVSGLMNLGAGVAYKIDSPNLQSIHHQLSAHFSEVLIPQDCQPLRPHITILNKSTPERARTLLTTLSKSFHPFTVTALGLDLWAYLGGPWRFERSIYFRVH